MPYAKISWLTVSARECMHSENKLCDPVYNHAQSLKRKLHPFLKSEKSILRFTFNFSSLITKKSL